VDETATEEDMPLEPGVCVGDGDLTERSRDSRLERGGDLRSFSCDCDCD
jgi:hypothetical protein